MLFSASSLLLPALLACKGKEVTSNAPPGLQPLEEENLAKAPTRSGDAYPESMNVVSGETDDYAWAHARGYVHADLATVWDAFATPEVVVDRRRVQEHDVTWDVEPEYDVSFILHNTSYDIVTVEFDLTWRQGATAGTAEDPDEVTIRWEKTDGSAFVYLLEGSVVLLPADDDVTEVQLIEHLATAGSGAEEVEAYFADLFDSVLAHIAGEALPTYE